jgi:hypothetical protein
MQAAVHGPSPVASAAPADLAAHSAMVEAEMMASASPKEAAA